ncbi:hypothetical protein [Wenzhouxiangella marina]|uniref:Uncharacterized protein n=1 Tax=Wenzhouxiangella marina TaxID=1579979 RepID=A0A0K0XS32_9GAMM|nr:hypothetical protein [Wenzhouxiangella marina]AKS40498.1 hypothetical protein WM2015_107 [Wenzhouxiangella marina]MBB6088180.1 hypothetical protein [Wenzhouxiangella marina]
MKGFVLGAFLVALWLMVTAPAALASGWQCSNDQRVCEAVDSGPAYCRIACDAAGCVCSMRDGPPPDDLTIGERADLVFEASWREALRAASPELARILGLDASAGRIALGPFAGGVSRVADASLQQAYAFEGHVEELDGVLSLEVEMSGDTPVRAISARFEQRDGYLHGEISHFDGNGEILSDAGLTVRPSLPR